MKFAILFVLLLLPAVAGAAGIWQASGVGAGAQSVWLDQGQGPVLRDVEVTGRGVVSLTPHVSAVGGIAYGFKHSYGRASFGARITATDVDNPSFSISLGASRHYTNESAGLGLLNEWASEGGFGWKPLAKSPILVTALASYGLSSGRRGLVAGLVWPFKAPASGGEQ